MAEWAYLNEQHVTIIVGGQPGAGKTSFAVRILCAVYDCAARPDAAARRILLGQEGLLDFLRMQERSKGRREKLVIFDDAGVWLSRWFLTKEKAAVLEALNYVRDYVAVAIFTFVSGNVAKFVRDYASVRVLVRLLSRQEKEALGLDPDDLWSVARVYRQYVAPDFSTRWRTLGEIVFRPRIPEPLYSRYYLRRRRSHSAQKRRELIELLAGRRG